MVYMAMDIWMVSSFWLLWINTAVIICVQIFVSTYVCNSLRWMPSSGITKADNHYMFNFLKKLTNYPKMVLPLYVPTSIEWGFQFLHIFANFGIVRLLDYKHSIVYMVVSYCNFNLHFPIANYIFLWLIIICKSSLVKYRLKYFTHFHSIVKDLCILLIQVFIRSIIWK